MGQLILSRGNAELKLKEHLGDIFKCFALEHNVSKTKHLRSVLKPFKTGFFKDTFA